MPRKNRPPSYRLHKARNCAVVTIHGKNHYLGHYGSPESHEQYARLIAECRADSPQVPAPAPTGSIGTQTVNELMLDFLGHASECYQKHGEPTGEPSKIRPALRPAKTLYGRTPVADFWPESFERVRDVDGG